MKIPALLLPSRSYACTRLLLGSWLLFLASPLLAAPEPEIEISGGTKALRENIRLHLSLVEESCTTPFWRLNSLLNDSEPEIKAAAQALGYYQLEYEAKLVRNQDCWGLDIQLTPGDPVLVT